VVLRCLRVCCSIDYHRGVRETDHALVNDFFPPALQLPDFRVVEADPARHAAVIACRDWLWLLSDVGVVVVLAEDNQACQRQSLRAVRAVDFRKFELQRQRKKKLEDALARGTLLPV